MLLDSYGGWRYFDCNNLLCVGQVTVPGTLPGYSEVLAGRRNGHVDGASEIANSLTSPTYT